MRRDPGALMIFAAGFGTRMGALTAQCPKPLLEAGGITLLDRAIATGLEAGVLRTVVNTHYLSEQVEAAVAGRDIAISRETPDILDTGGGLRNAADALGCQFVYTLNPDALHIGPNPLSVLRHAWRKSDASALLLLVPPDRAEMRSGGGDFALGPDGELTRGGPLIYTGAQIIDTGGLRDMPGSAFSLNAYWDRLAGEGRLHGVVYPGRWCDVGTPEALTRANAMTGKPSGD